MGNEDIPVTYVPARNTVFLAYALAWGEVLPAYDLFIGVNAVDYSGYPDCRNAFIRAMQNTLSLAMDCCLDAVSTRNLVLPDTRSR